MIKNFNKDLQEAIIGISIFLLYMFFQLFQTLPLSILGIDIEQMSLTAKMMYSIATEIMILLVIILILKDKLKKDLIDFKNNNKQYFNTYFKYWLLAISLMIISNALIMVLTPNSISANEEAIRDIFDKAPIYMFASAVFFAPLIEELVFRQGFRQTFKTDIVFILISGFIFGGLHVFSSAETYYDFLYLIPYCVPGIIFAYVLTKSKNIFVPISLHFIHNGLMMSLQVFVLLFG